MYALFAAGRNRFEVTTAGQVVKVTQRWIGGAPCGGPRGEVREWSMRSRIRALQACYSVTWPKRLTMITLTYPGVAEADVVATGGSEVKRHQNAFRAAWQRRFGRPAGFWKLEFQERGAPHLHLWLQTPAGVTAGELAVWVGETWSRVIGSTSAEALLNGTQAIEWAGNPGRYVAAYTRRSARKEHQHRVPEWFERPGRFWGMWGMKPEPVTRPLSLKRYVKLRRSLRRYQEHRGRRVATRGLQGMWAQVDGRAAHVVGRLLEPPRQPSRGRVSRPRLVARRQQHGKEQEGETAHDGGQDDQGAGRADGPPKAL